MDTVSIEAPAAAAAAGQGRAPPHTVAEDDTRRRPPLLPSEKKNSNNAPPAAVRKLTTREVASRYKQHGISSAVASLPTRRCSSTPNASLLPKHAQPAERRMPLTPCFGPSVPAMGGSLTQTNNYNRRLLRGRNTDELCRLTRNLSSTFQSEAVPVPVPVVSKGDNVFANSSLDDTLNSSANTLSERERTHLRGRRGRASDESENSKPVGNAHIGLIGQHAAFQKIMDLTGKVEQSASLMSPLVSSRRVSPRGIPGMDGVGKGLQHSTSVAKRQVIFDGMGRKIPASASTRNTDLGDKAASVTIPSRGVSPKRMFISDGAGTGLQHSTTGITRQGTPYRCQTAEHVMSLKVNASSHYSESAALVKRPTRTQSVPIMDLPRPSSSHRTFSMPISSSRGIQSPSLTWPSISSSSCGATSRTGASSSVFGYVTDGRKEKDRDRIEDAHQLRLLYNRALQWRSVNARAEQALSIQKTRTENILYSVRDTVSELSDSLIAKRINLQHLMQDKKLDIIVKNQLPYLENWDALEREYYSSLSGTVESFQARTLRVPFTGETMAEIHPLKNALSSAVDVMHAMSTSICYLLSKVEGTSSLVSELSVVAAKERVMLDECKELLTSTEALLVQECSLRTHLIQLRHDTHKME